MKKVVVASFLSVSAALVSDSTLWAQAAPAGGQVQMDAKEFAEYDNAVNKQTTPQTQAPALETYLKDYPNSAVKADILQRLMLDYFGIFQGSASAADGAKAVSAADNVLQIDPNNIRADYVEVVTRRTLAEALTDAAARQSGLDAAASYAQEGYQRAEAEGQCPTPDFKTLQNGVAPYLL